MVSHPRGAGELVGEGFITPNTNYGEVGLELSREGIYGSGTETEELRLDISSLFVS